MRMEILKTWMVRIIAILLAILMVSTGLVYIFTR